MRLKLMKRLVVAAAFATAAAATVGAVRASEATLRDAVQLAATAMWLDYKSLGLVFAVVRGADAAVLGFGETAKGSGVEPDGRTLLRIGSISKVFAGHLLASLATDGRMRLGDPAVRFLPDVKLPEAGGRPIALIDLVTHAAGFPRDLPGEPRSGINPYELFSWTNYKAYLASAQLGFPPGTAAAYSNLGFDVLGAALTAAGGTTYAELLKVRITGPLGMIDTVVRLDEAQRKRLMVGHDFDGKPMEPLDVLETQAGSGGLYSTADDMLRYMRWHLDRRDPAGDIVRVVDHALYLQRDGLDMAVGFDAGGQMDAIGLAWLGMMPAGPRTFILQKTGALEGFMSYVAIAPSRGVGVFVAVNQFNFGGFSGLTKAVNGLVAELAPR